MSARPNGDYTRFLNPRGLAGARIGVPRAGFVDEARHGEVVARGDRAASAARRDRRRSRQTFRQPPPVCRDQAGARGKDVDCSIVFKYGMKRDFNAWLASLGPRSPVKTLTELREWNLAHRAEGAIKYGQAQLDNSDEVDLERDRARYLADRATDVRVTGAEGIDAVMKRERLDALVFVGSTGAAVAAKPGYPTVIVPFALVPNAAAAVSVRVRCEAGASWHQLYRRRVQRAAPDRNRVRVRAGDEAADSAGGISIERGGRNRRV